MMSKFKVGDVVRYVQDLYGPTGVFEIGKEYIVDHVEEDLIVCKNTDNNEWFEDRFELVDSVDSTKERLYALAKAFIKDQYIFCEEDIYQSDRVIENAYQFLAEVFAIVGEQE